MYSKILGPENRVLKDRDSTGTDLKNIVAKSTLDCEKACVKQVGCNSYTYIDAYSSCWLKKGKAKLIDKKFSCYIK